MDNNSTIMADASGMRNLVRFAQVNGLQMSAFLDADLMEFVRQSETQERIPAQAMVDVLELMSIACRRPSLAIELSSWVDIRAIGMLSILLDACPTISEALRIQSQYVHLESFALDSLVEEADGEVMVKHIMRVAGQFGHSQYAEGAMMVAIRMIRMTAGEMWSPLRIEFEHQAPDDLRIHRAQFRCPIAFGAEHNAFYLAADEMHKPLPRGNPKALAYLEKQLETLSHSLRGTIEAEVSTLIAQNLSSGNANLATVAKTMGLQPRALQRRLANDDLEFSEILNKVRRQVVENYVRSERHPELMRLAYRLGYSEASNASRFLRQQFGTGLRGLIAQARSERERQIVVN